MAVLGVFNSLTCPFRHTIKLLSGAILIQYLSIDFAN